MALEHGILLLQGIHALRLLKQLDIRAMLLTGNLLELLAHQVELLLEQVDLAVLSIDQLLLAAQIDLHSTLLLLHQ